MQDHNLGEFFVALVIDRCVNETEATMETARSVEEDRLEVYASVGSKMEELVYGCHPVEFVAVDSHIYLYTCVRKYEWLLASRKTVPAWYRLMVCHANVEKSGQVRQVKPLTLLQDP